MSEKAQTAYTEFIKTMLDKVRELKNEGYDVSECNRLLQSLVSAVLESDFNCADFLINELKSTISALKDTPPFVGHKIVNHRMPLVAKELRMPDGTYVYPDKYRYVYRKPAMLPPHNKKPSTLLVVLIYSFLTLFIVLIFTLISYIGKWS